jgi:hypothetical protein
LLKNSHLPSYIVEQGDQIEQLLAY